MKDLVHLKHALSSAKILKKVFQDLWFYAWATQEPFHGAPGKGSCRIDIYIGGQIYVLSMYSMDIHIYIYI